MAPKFALLLAQSLGYRLTVMLTTTLEKTILLLAVNSTYLKTNVRDCDWPNDSRDVSPKRFYCEETPPPPRKKPLRIYRIDVDDFFPIQNGDFCQKATSLQVCIRGKYGTTQSTLSPAILIQHVFLPFITQSEQTLTLLQTRFQPLLSTMIHPGGRNKVRMNVQNIPHQ